MTAELNRQHLATLNQAIVGGRAETAPNLDSVEVYVQAWYEDITGDGEDGTAGYDRELERQRVRF